MTTSIIAVKNEKKVGHDIFQQFAARHVGEYVNAETAFGTPIQLYRVQDDTEAEHEDNLIAAAHLPSKRGLAVRAELARIGYVIDWQAIDDLRAYLDSVPPGAARDDDGDN